MGAGLCHSKMWLDNANLVMAQILLITRNYEVGVTKWYTLIRKVGCLWMVEWERNLRKWEWMGAWREPSSKQLCMVEARW